MRFATPEWLWLLLAMPALVAAGLFFSWRRRSALRDFAGGSRHYPRFAAGVGHNRRTLKAVLLFAMVLFGILAAARPQWGGRQEPVTRSGNDVMIMLDTSLSMACEDVSPDRFQRALLAAESLVRRLPGDRIGLVTFSGAGMLNCPLTLDHGAVKMFMDAVDIRSDSVPGTALSDALTVALNGFSSQHGDGRGKSIVLFTDGEDHEAGLDDFFAAAGKQNLVLHAVGVGSLKGAPIPVSGEDGGISGFKTDREDRVVTTRLNENLLEDLARRTGGIYRRSTAGGGEIQDLVDQLRGEDGGELGTVLRIRYEERFQYPLFLAFLALLTEFLLPDDAGGRRKKRRKAREGTS
jgi:Ca-activated chloride channel family protein